MMGFFILFKKTKSTYSDDRLKMNEIQFFDGIWL